MKVDKAKKYYAIAMNMTGLHDIIYTLKWHEEYETFCDLRNDFGVDMVDMRAGKEIRDGYKVWVYDDRKKAAEILKILQAYRDHLKELM